MPKNQHSYSNIHGIMAPKESSFSIMADYPEYSNIAKSTRKKALKDLKTNCMKMTAVLQDKNE